MVAAVVVVTEIDAVVNTLLEVVVFEIVNPCSVFAYTELTVDATLIAGVCVIVSTKFGEFNATTLIVPVAEIRANALPFGVADTVNVVALGIVNT